MANQTANQAMAKRDDQRGTMRYAIIPSPFDLMRRFTDDVDRLFLAIAGGDPFAVNARSARPMAATASLATWVPSVEVTTRGDDLVIQADLPGVKPEDVQVELD